MIGAFGAMAMAYGHTITFWYFFVLRFVFSTLNYPENESFGKLQGERFTLEIYSLRTRKYIFASVFVLRAFFNKCSIIM
jgi:hypothetical protein